jgi:hypothetical protein
LARRKTILVEAIGGGTATRFWVDAKSAASAAPEQDSFNAAGLVTLCAGVYGVGTLIGGAP